MNLLRTAVVLLALTFGTATVAQSAPSVWGVNAADQIWQWLGNGQWKQIQGGLSNVSIGGDGTVWGVNRAGQIWSWDGTRWTMMPGALVQVSVGSARDIWGVNAGDDIWRWDGAKWTQVPGKLRNVSIGSDGTVWGVNRSGVIFSRTGDTWKQMPGALVQVSVGTATNVWGVNANDDIWRWDGTKWAQVPGKLTHVAAAGDGTVWGVNRGGAIFSRTGETWTQMPGGLTQVAVAGSLVVNVNAAPNIAPPPTTVTVNAAPNIPPPATTVTVNAAPNIPPPGTSTGTNMIVLQGTTSIPVGGSTATSPAQSQPQLTLGTVTPTYLIGKAGSSYATCGVQGTGFCQAQPALFLHNSSSSCPSGSFMDIGRMSCWSCPSGYTRGIAAVDTARACTQPNANQGHEYQKSTFRGHLCEAGSFYDPIRGGECWKCDSGYQRSAAHVEAGNACVVPLHEDFSYASRDKQTIWPHECSGGTFWDGYQGGRCWSCPSGFRRTAYHITDSKACAKTVGEQTRSATLVRKAQCGPGEFIDLKIPGQQNIARGGGCYTCPTAYERTIHPIDHDQACWHPAGVRFASATRTQPLACESNEFFDPISSANPAMRAALDDRNQRDPANHVSQATIGGTCWMCPAGAKRTTAAVYSGQACNPPGILWKPAPYHQPGLFGLKRAEAVALKLVQDRVVIDQIISSLKQGGAADYPQRVWEEIGQRPWDSTVLRMAVYSRVVNAATNPSTATADEIELRNDVVERIRQFRMFMAQDALDAYDAWKANEMWRQSQYARSQLQQITDLGDMPPDFEAITAESILGGLVASAGASTAIYLALAPEAVRKLLFPFAFRTTWTAAKPVSALGTKLAISGYSKLATELASKVGNAVRSGAQAGAGISATAASIGPQIIVTIGIEILAVAIEQQIDKDNARPKLLASLATATDSRVDFARLMATEQGVHQADGYWSQLMAGPAAINGQTPAPIGAQNGAAFQQAANNALAVLRQAQLTTGQ